MHYRGAEYIAIGWILITLAMGAVGIRLYSRIFLTRSIGSDDFTIVIAMILALAGIVGDTLAVSHGVGHHSDQISGSDYAQGQRWMLIDWIIVYIAMFMIRSSVMLFVLRLLPPTKKLEQKIIFVVFALNVAITLIATVSYGVLCRPFEANYYSVPGAKCAPSHVRVVTNQVNGILACLIDIVTALMPQFLLWRVQMKWTTKWALNIVFGLGLITSGLSIGRVATMNDGIWSTDVTWREMPTSTFCMVEEQGGIIFASCPAVRQFFAYRIRTGTALPTKLRQGSNTDFVSMRRRINFRDIFWYRKPIVEGGRVSDVTPTFITKLSKSSTSHTRARNDLEKSPLDIWEDKAKDMAHTNSPSQTNIAGTHPSAQHSTKGRKFLTKLGSAHLPSSLKSKFTSFELLRSNDSARAARLEQSAERGQGWPGLGSEPETRTIAKKYDAWGLPSDVVNSEVSSADKSAAIERDDSLTTEAERPLTSDQDLNLAEALAAGGRSSLRIPEPSHRGLPTQATPRDALEAGDSRSEDTSSSSARSTS